jgi:tetratricopeptide (TPR) repeat protein
MGNWSDKQLKTLVCVALALGTFAVYWPALHYGFIDYDDPTYITLNPHLRTSLTVDSLKWAFSSGYAGNWHPLTWLSHLLDVTLFGLDAAAHHSVNVLLHVANSLLLFLVLARMARALWPSAFVAALFAWHPLHVESVAWIAERKDVLSAFFGLLTLWAYVRYAETGRRSRLWLSVLLFALGLMAKPMLVTLPFLLLLLDFWPLKRLGSNSQKKEAVPRRHRDKAGQAPPPANKPAWKDWVPLLQEKAPFFILSALSSVVTFAVQQHGGAVALLNAVPLSYRLSNALVSYARYVFKTVWPAKLAVIYPLPGEWPWWQVALSGLLLLCLTAAAIRARRRFPCVLIGWLWFLGTLVPVIGLVQVGEQSMADRYTYLPLIGLFVAVAWTAAELTANWRMRTTALAAGAMATLLLCLGLTAVQVLTWDNSLVLFEHAITVTRGNHVAHHSLAKVLASHWRLDEAAAHCEEAARIFPGLPGPHFTLGVLRARQGKFSEAAAQYEAALRLEQNSTTHFNLGNALVKLGRLDEAVAHYAEATRLDPKLAEAHLNAAVACDALGKAAEASRLFENALRIEPNYAAARRGYGRLLARQGRLAEAAAQFTELIRQNPDDAEAQFNLAQVLTGAGKIEEALTHYRAAARTQPDSPAVLDPLARLLATHPDDRFRNGAEAVQWAERACELTQRKNPAYLDTLAAAYAEAGRFSNAVATAATAVQVAAASGQTGLGLQLYERVQLYRSNRPYREPVSRSNP